MKRFGSESEISEPSISLVTSAVPFISASKSAGRQKKTLQRADGQNELSLRVTISIMILSQEDLSGKNLKDFKET